MGGRNRVVKMVIRGRNRLQTVCFGGYRVMELLFQRYRLLRRRLINLHVVRIIDLKQGVILGRERMGRVP